VAGDAAIPDAGASTPSLRPFSICARLIRISQANKPASRADSTTNPLQQLKVVMAGPAAGRVPAIHVLQTKKIVDGRHKAGHDNDKEPAHSFITRTP
jgi:hypothetical protein